MFRHTVKSPPFVFAIALGLQGLPVIGTEVAEASGLNVNSLRSVQYAQADAIKNFITSNRLTGTPVGMVD